MRYFSHAVMLTLSYGVIGLLLWCFVSQVATACDITPSNSAEGLEAAGSVTERRERTRDLLKSAEQERIKRLIVHESDDVALAAAWELVRRTMPEANDAAEEPPASKPIDSRAVHRFLGVAQGRLRTEIPTWWEKRLLGSTAFSQDVLAYPDFQSLGRPATTPQMIGDFRLAGFFPQDQGLSSKDETTVYTKDSVQSLIPNEIMDRLGVRPISAVISGSSQGDRYFVASHSDLSGRYSLCSWVHGRSDLEWCEWVWTGFPSVPGTSGAGHVHYSWIIPTESTVYVFGDCGYWLYIEGFRIEDGQPSFRFSTSY